MGKFMKVVRWVSSFRLEVSGCGLNSVKLQPAAQEIPILRNDNSLCEELVLALRASGIVNWNAKRLD